MSGEDAFAAFEARHGTDVATQTMERIADAHWNGGKGDGVVFNDIHQHNACNHTLSGTIEVGTETFGFIIDSGDWNGTVVRAWGDPEDIGTYDPPKPTLYTFVPRDDHLKERSPGLYAAYLQWREQPWFKEKERGYNYDRHFAPGGKTETHYRDWADSKGLKVAIVGDEP